jgi:hypothetical protein
MKTIRDLMKPPRVELRTSHIQLGEFGLSLPPLSRSDEVRSQSWRAK